ncbi:hypothetical protein IEQ34_010366 [Dendrobium chrysotoxum]|uniref:H(+)-exporting diphosphatase n=1 Tax=Dendrobium chrysotoxum TaxID=161865 RepID=A0AAV7H1A1_DENCH|nr:hypothetical protein IEQ34_010366 [Dendrobium chrysotoxum]
MGEAIVSDLLTEILIPVAAVIGIAFAVVQWVFVSKVKVSPERQGVPSSNNKNGLDDYLLDEEEEGGNEHNVAVKCAEIQNAISEGCLALNQIYDFCIAVKSFCLFHCKI